MGFFSDLFSGSKVYTEQELWRYFSHEIFGTLHFEEHRDDLSTNINRVLSDNIKELYPQASTWDFEKLNSYDVTKLSENVFRLDYKGRLAFVKGRYGELLTSFLYYNVIVYTDKCAKLTEYNGARTTVKVFKQAPKY